MLSKMILPAFVILFCRIESVYSGAYCAKVCGEDPCGNGKAQQATCASPNIANWETFGFDGERNFVGCSMDVCEAECVNMNATLEMDNQNGTFCFSMERKMYSDKDLAELSAISRGCTGNHFMTSSQLYMIGDSHPACDETYSEEGFAFTSSGSKITFTAIAFAASALGLFVLT